MKDKAVEKLVFMVTKSSENPEMALLPFVQAVGALTMDVEVVMVLMANSVWLARRDYGRSVTLPGKPRLDELLKNFFELGGTLLVCRPCIEARNMTQEDLVEGAELIASARFTEEALSAKAVLSY